MKRNLFLFLLVILLMLIVRINALPEESETIVKFSSNSNSFITDYSLKPIFSHFAYPELARSIGLDRYYRAQLDDETFEVFRSSDLVESAERYQDDFSFHTTGYQLTNDPFFSLQYALYNRGQEIKGNFGIADADIDASDLFFSFKPKYNVTVAVIDSGVDMNHPDLVGNLLPGWDPYLETEDVTDSYFGHGTHVIGIIAAMLNNKEGIVGVNPYAKIIPLQITTPGEYTPWVVAASIVEATNRKSNVISMSFGTGADYQIIQDAVRYAYASDIVLVASVGNAGINFVTYPAAYSEVIGVGATDNRDKIADFSNFGKGIDLVAPGVDVYSTYPTFFDDSIGY